MSFTGPEFLLYATISACDLPVTYYRRFAIYKTNQIIPDYLTFLLSVLQIEGSLQGRDSSKQNIYFV